ncbi:MAG TPA: gliding motility-associated C-terminal domain-containing protein [Chitinophagaceae bacterium]|nr:gliding motility-associated C-terminal domain-containing protein [Chitinophagaceae bacterium]HNM33736.1 gliding motility-associated C-terminal domain-containing protein [Chitinophagaceae bacterium]
MIFRYILLLIICSTYCSTHLLSQCNTTISTFPYHEDFEAGQGNWTTGGNNNDWQYGTPSKSIITGAASGTKCWIVGKLTGNFYNFGENAWIMSPCYDFSSLTNPQISFSVFWETERKYDGATFQYSVNGGNTWNTLGSTNSNNNCNGVNWFNYSPITSLGVDGWSGTKLPTSGSCNGTGGSDGWVTSKHILTGLAGQNNVRFRFVFGAGTTCNSFNGFAVDDITISEAPVNTCNFIFSCTGNNTVNFTNTSSICATNFNWNFGDNASPSNTSNAENPTHIFTAPGTYNVSLTVTFPGNIIVNKIKTVTVLSVNTSIVNSIKCNGDSTGSALANVTGGGGAYNYNWNTNPVQTTNTATNLKAGSYTVTVSATNTCTTNSTIIFTQPDSLKATSIVANELCKQQNGFIEVVTTGGVLPYTYLWNTNPIQNTSKASNLKAGNYAVIITDANLCKLSMNNSIKDSINNINLNLGNDTSFCPGSQLILNAGAGFANYVWQNASTNATFTATQTGNYFVIVTDKDGCTKTDTIKINVDCSDIYFPTAFTPNSDGLNDTFGALGNLFSLTSYQFYVYGRWGQLIFYTNNAFEKWDGKQNGNNLDSGTYIWFATYSINNKPLLFKKGTVIMIR